LQDFEIELKYFCEICKEAGEEIFRAIQSMGDRADVAASLENQAPGRRTSAQAQCRLSDPDNRSSDY
jgi:hypothetical protein